jgi:hypothetical protein
MGVVRKADFRDRYLKVTHFDDGAKGVALDVMSQTGRISDAAMAGGVSVATVRSHMEKNSEFAQAWEVARQTYADKITGLIEERAFIGIEEPIIGGKFRDEVVGHKRVYSDSLAVMHAKRYVEEYREKQQVDVAVVGGVLAVATSMPSTERGAKDWDKIYNGAYEPGSIKPEAPPALPKKKEPDDVAYRSAQGAGELEGEEAVQRSREPDGREWGAVGQSPGVFEDEAGPSPTERRDDAGDNIDDAENVYGCSGGDGRETLF